jgi:hypothetical protein
MAFTHTKKVIYIGQDPDPVPNVRIQPKRFRSDQKGSDPTGSGSATLIVSIASSALHLLKLHICGPENVALNTNSRCKSKAVEIFKFPCLHRTL